MCKFYKKKKKEIQLLLGNGPFKSYNTIMAKINDSKNVNRRCAAFYEARISQSTINELKAQGYKIKLGISEITGAPYFIVSW